MENQKTLFPRKLLDDCPNVFSPHPGLELTSPPLPDDHPAGLQPGLQRDKYRVHLRRDLRLADVSFLWFRRCLPPSLSELASFVLLPGLVSFLNIKISSCHSIYAIVLQCVIIRANNLCIYIYIERERDRERERCLYMHMCVYVCVYVCIYIYIYIYICICTHTHLHHAMFITICVCIMS